MGGQQDKRQQPGKDREREDLEATGQDPVHPGSAERARGKSPEEMKRHREDDTTRERAGDEMRDEEL